MFKVGDKVKFKEEYQDYEYHFMRTRGAIYTVSGVCGDKDDWDNLAVGLEGYSCGSYAYKLEVVEAEGMIKNKLKSGMRVVHGNHPRGPITGIVILDMGLIVFEGVNGGYNYLDNYTPQLLGSNPSWDVTEVYDVDLNEVLNPNRKQKLIWKRETKSESEKQLDAVMEKLAELQKEAEQLQETIKKEKK